MRSTVPIIGLLGATTLAPTSLIGAADAGVIRHDRDDSLYTALAAQSEFDPNVLLTIGGGGTCSGTLIGGEWVLTAAHCFDGQADPRVNAGSMANGFEIIGSEEVIVHPDWQTGDFTGGADLALVKLSTPFQTIGSASLFSGTDEIGRTGTSVGWGRTGDGLTGFTEPSGTKRAGTNTIDALGSDRGWDESILITDFDNPLDPGDSTYASAIPTDLEIQVAPGDSGGSLFVEVDGEMRLAGITSFINVIDGSPDGDYGEMSAYTRVSAYEDWIRSTIPAPATLAPLVVGVGALSRRRR